MSSSTSANTPADETNPTGKQKWSEPTPPVPEGMSKRAWKRELKKQKMESKREEFAEKRREKKKQQKLARKELLENDPESVPKKEPKKGPPADQEKTSIGVIVDCGFDDKMKDGERVSLGSQLIRCYSGNRNASKQVNLRVTSFTGALKERFDTVLHQHYKQWKDISLEEQDYTPDPQSMLYLSSDSDNVIERLEPGKTYIIGGIVDKGRHKNLCNGKALAQGIPTARLPIDEYVKISGRRVLTTNHVFEILLQWLEKEDWKEAFESVLPQRKMT